MHFHPLPLNHIPRESFIVVPHNNPITHTWIKFRSVLSGGVGIIALWLWATVCALRNNSKHMKLVVVATLILNWPLGFTQCTLSVPGTARTFPTLGPKRKCASRFPLWTKCLCEAGVLTCMCDMASLSLDVPPNSSHHCATNAINNTFSMWGSEEILRELKVVLHFPWIKIRKGTFAWIVTPLYRSCVDQHYKEWEHGCHIWWLAKQSVYVCMPEVVSHLKRKYPLIEDVNMFSDGPTVGW